jgi:DMSO/TMAO reductase YedYZ molybdopterin-dependent catalytic subunit
MRLPLPLPDPDRPPPGPFRAEFWRSPLRTPKLTAILGLVLLIGLPIVALTGLLSNDAYQPGLGGNALGRHTGGPLDLYLFGWPAGTPWLYALNQGLHVTLGLALFPVVLAKLWSVIPKLFAWPPVRDPLHGLERLSLALLVGGALFEFVTGTLNVQYWYVFGFSFTQAHYYGAWVFIGALISHVALKFGTMRHDLTAREEVLAAAAPAAGETWMSRRAMLGAVGGASAILALQGLGESAGGPLRTLAFLVPRGQTGGDGPLDFPVTKTWVSTGLAPEAVGDAWRLTVSGTRTVTLTRAQLLAMPQHTYVLPIGCVEGWSTTQAWTGVRLRDLAAVAGLTGPATLTTRSLEHGTYGHAVLGHEQVAAEDSLLALTVNGHTLSLDHGYPARVISPALPGVHCTKWVTALEFTRWV